MVKAYGHARYIFFIGIILAITGAITWYMLAGGRIALFTTSYYSPLYATGVYSLYDEAKISQNFEARYPGLYQVDLYFAANGVDEDGQVIFHLKDSCETTQDLETRVVSYTSLVAHEFYPFTFSPIDDSAGRTFCLVLETRGLEEAGVLKIYASLVNVYPAGAATYHQPDSVFARQKISNVNPTYVVWLPIIQKSEALGHQEFDLGFNLHYNGPVLATMQALLAYLAIYKPYVFGIPLFYVSLLVVYGVALVIVGKWAFKVCGPKL